MGAVPWTPLVVVAVLGVAARWGFKGKISPLLTSPVHGGGTPSPLTGRAGEGAILSKLPQAVLLSLCVLLALLSLLLCALPPDGNEWDALAYHLAFPKLYLQAGRMVEIPFMHQSYFPPLQDMLYLWGLSVAGESAAKVMHWAVGMLAVLGAAGFVQRRGISGMWAAALILGAPLDAEPLGAVGVWRRVRAGCVGVPDCGLRRAGVDGACALDTADRGGCVGRWAFTPLLKVPPASRGEPRSGTGSAASRGVSSRRGFGSPCEQGEPQGGGLQLLFL